MLGVLSTIEKERRFSGDWDIPSAGRLRKGFGVSRRAVAAAKGDFIVAPPVLADVKLKREGVEVGSKVGVV